MDPGERDEMLRFEKEVKEMCESADAETKLKGEWLRDNVVRCWIFLVDGNSRSASPGFKVATFGMWRPNK